jgi:hypothetical protein
MGFVLARFTSKGRLTQRSASRKGYMQQREGPSSEQRKRAKPVLPLWAYQLAKSYRLGRPTARYRSGKSLFEVALFFFVPASVF